MTKLRAEADGADHRMVGSRAERLEQRRQEKMAANAHAFVRGNTADHYAWLADLPRALPEGPPVWICGDCHAGNLGPLAGKDGAVAVQIRDLDQTVIGNPAHDLVRLALSLASAVRGSDLPGVTTVRVLEEMMSGYETGLDALDDEEPVAEPDLVRTVKREALGRRWRDLAKERLRDVRPSIPLGRKFWALSDDERWHVGVLLDTPAVKDLILTFGGKPDHETVELVDAAYWMKGCSSLGNYRFAALVRVGGRRKSKFALIDIKEAVAPVAPARADAHMPSHFGERVVAGARALSPNLGDRMATGDLMGRPVVIRELMPEDLKLEIEQFSRPEALGAARYLAFVVGKAHGRQMSPEDRAKWVGQLRRMHPDDDAPSWLWTTVVALMIRHEEAYLEHCRRFARGNKPG